MLRFYENTLTDFEVVPTIDSEEDSGRAFLKQGRPLLVSVAQHGQKAIVTLSEVGGGDADPASPPGRR